MYSHLSDSVLDSCLRDVPVPVGLVARLKQTDSVESPPAAPAVIGQAQPVLPEDAELDEALRSVSIPHGTVKRLLLTIQDETLDETLRQTEIPQNLLVRLRTIPHARPRSAWRRFAVAASLLLVLFSAYCGTLGALLAAIRPQQDLDGKLSIIDLGPFESRADSAYAQLLAGSEASATASHFVPPTSVATEPLLIELARLDITPEPGPAGRLFREVQRGAPLTRDLFLMGWPTLGSPQRSDQALPELSHVRRRDVAGVDLPLATGYDRSFFLKSGVHPPVLPGASQRVRTIDVPLVTQTDSVESARRLVLEGRLPAPSDIRVEDYIAAVEYGLEPSSDQSLALHASAGRSMFGRQPHHMLHLGVKAPRVSTSKSTHLSIVLDVSTSMRGVDRIGAVRRALETLRRHLGPDDSVSFVAVNHEIVRQIEFLPASQFARLTSLLSKLTPAGGDNLALGFQAAMSLAFEAEVAPGSARHVVLLTDGYAKVGDRDAGRMRDLMATGETHSIGSTVLQLDSLLAGDAAVSWTALGRASAVSPSQLPWALVAIATGKSPVVARQAKLRAVFNPQAVSAYRLVGHGPTALTGLVEVEADLRSGEEASALFELWLRPNRTPDVGWAEVHWTDPGSRLTIVSERLPIGRKDFAGSVEETPWALQTAAIAAEVGQRLARLGTFELRSGGRFARQPKPAGWKDVLQQAARVNPHTSGPAEFQHLVDFVRQLEELGPGRTN